MKYIYKNINHFIQGKSHIDNDIPCQDRTIYKNKIDVHTITLSDGAGSCVKAEIGADESSKITADYLNSNFDRLYQKDEGAIGEEIINHIRNEIEKKYADKEFSFKDLSSTLLFYSTKFDKFIMGHIGDGGIASFKDNQVSIASEPENGETANSTFFWTSDNAVEHFRIKKGKIEDNMAIMLMSDGTHECLFDKPKESYSSATEKIFEWIEHEELEEASNETRSTMTSLFRKKTTDDCSINILLIQKEFSILDLLYMSFTGKKR